MASLVTTIAALGRAVGTILHPRENFTATGTLAATNATLETFCDGCATVTLDLRGTFSLSAQVQGTVDGTNWQVITIRPQIGGKKVATLTGTTAGTWQGNCSGFTKVRVIDTAHTSGSATTVLAASNALMDDGDRFSVIAEDSATITGTAGAATTLTVAAPGAGLRHYITRIEIDRINASTTALTAAAAPITVTTTNLPTSVSFKFPADALAAGGIQTRVMDYGYPLMSTAQNTATTIVCPLTASVQWTVTAYFFVAP